MDIEFNMVSYRVAKILSDFSCLSNGANRISLSISSEIGYPLYNDEKKDNIVVKIKATFLDTDKDYVVLETLTEALFATNNENTDSDDLINSAKAICVPIVYNKAKDVIDTIIKISKISFISLPEYDEMVDNKN